MQKLILERIICVVIIIPLTFCLGLNSGCKCQIYDNEYMNCNCCPRQTERNYTFSISYTIKSRWETVPGNCTRERASDDRSCDCVFCGRITDDKNPFHNVCSDHFYKRKDYTLTVTYSSDNFSGSYVHKFNTNASILLPTPPKLLNLSSELKRDGSAALDIEWEVHHYFLLTTLNCTITWELLGNDLVEVHHDNRTRGSYFKQMVRTNKIITTLTGLLPNRVYNIGVSCRHPKSMYESRKSHKLVRTAERRPETAPELINYRVNHCNDEGMCDITIFWKGLASADQSANCTEYFTSVTGPEVTTNQSYSCKDVMTQIGKPLIRNSSYDITLRYVSKPGSSPPSMMRTAPLHEIKRLETPSVIIERNQSTVTINVRWQHDEPPPTHYKVYYCQGNPEMATEKCERNIVQETINGTDDGNATWWTNNPGEHFLYNIATYWGNVTSGLQKDWLCVFDKCGDLRQPEVALTHIQEDGFSMVVKESWCPPFTSNRGSPLFYAIELLEADSKKVVQSHALDVWSLAISLTGLNADRFYILRTKSQGHCNTHSPVTEKRFKTKGSRKVWLVFWAIPLIVAVASLVMLVIVSTGVFHYKRHLIKIRKSLEINGNDNRSVLSWLGHNAFPGDNFHDESNSGVVTNAKEDLEQATSLEVNNNTHEVHTAVPGCFRESVKQKQTGQNTSGESQQVKGFDDPRNGDSVFMKSQGAEALEKRDSNIAEAIDDDQTSKMPTFVPNTVFIPGFEDETCATFSSDDDDSSTGRDSNNNPDYFWIRDGSDSKMKHGHNGRKRAEPSISSDEGFEASFADDEPVVTRLSTLPAIATVNEKNEDNAFQSQQQNNYNQSVVANKQANAMISPQTEDNNLQSNQECLNKWQTTSKSNDRYLIKINRDFNEGRNSPIDISRSEQPLDFEISNQLSCDYDKSLSNSLESEQDSYGSDGESIPMVVVALPKLS